MKDVIKYNLKKENYQHYKKNIMEKKVFAATGKRKSSVAQVRMVPGSGKITVNGKDVNEYMPFATLVMDLKQPLVITNNENTFDITVNVKYNSSINYLFSYNRFFICYVSYC